MSTEHSALLAYGYDLGSSESPGIKETSGYAKISTDWFKRDDEGYLDEEIDVAVTRRLYESLPGPDPEDVEVDHWQREAVVKERMGVWIETHGWPHEGQPSFALVAHCIEVDGGDSRMIGPATLESMIDRLDQKLDHALELLAGFTPAGLRGWILMAVR